MPCRFGEWVDPKDELPKCQSEDLLFERVRCLAYCSTPFGDEGEDLWSGYLDVYFSPRSGWFRCEESLLHKNTPFSVIVWTKWPGVPGDDKFMPIFLPGV